MLARSTVLVVDDEPLILASICRLIEDMEINLLTAGNSEEALALLHEHEVAVLLTDQCMPGMSGLDLLNEVGRSWPATVGILISGKKICPEAEAALARGRLQAYLNKPWDAGELMTAVDSALSRYQSHSGQEPEV